MKLSTAYPGVAIYEGALGEPPKAGAFYTVKAGDNLSKIARPVGLTYYKLCIHPWNLENLVYVVKATGGARCSPVAKTKLEKQTGFISMCKVGGEYQTLWVPGLNMEGPADISASLQQKATDAKKLVFNAYTTKSAKGALAAAKAAASTLEQQKAALNDGVSPGTSNLYDKSAPAKASLTDSPQPVKAGMSTGMIVGMVSVAIAVSLLFFLPTKKVKR